jgi:hypothetical protein
MLLKPSGSGILLSDPLYCNKGDRILLNLSEADRKMVIAKRQPAAHAESVFIFDIVLRRAA